MIAKLTGIIDEIGEGWIILNVNGVGYMVFCSQKTINNCPIKYSEYTLYIETHVREDHFHLYGFENFIEQQWFRILLSVQGVGAKVALAIQYYFDPSKLSKLISEQNKTAFTEVSGIGAKLAQRIVNELKDKVPSDLISQTISGDNLELDVGEDLVNAESALINLGFRKRDIDQVLAKLYNEQESIEFEDLIKESLKRTNKTGEIK